MNATERSASTAARHLLLYDGVCGLCNRLVAFVLPRDPAGVFHFAALQSAVGRSIVRERGHDPDALDTFHVVADYRSANPIVIRKGRAAMFVLKTLGWPWKFLAVLDALPDSLLDAGYDFVARRRYRLFGRYETCLLPSAEYRSRFDDADCGDGLGACRVEIGDGEDASGPHEVGHDHESGSRRTF